MTSKDNNYHEVLERGSRVIMDHKKRQALLRKIKFFNFLKNGFWLFLIVDIVLGLGYFGYTYKDVATKVIKDQVAAVFNQKTATVSSSVTSASCEDIVISINKDDSSKKDIPALVVGKCGNIKEVDREFWKNTFSDSSQVDGYAKYVLSKSTDKSMSVSEVSVAIEQSLYSNLLDLRKTQIVATVTPEVTLENTITATIAVTPTIEVTATPESTSTPAAQAVPFPEKERQLDLSNLVKTMQSHNILTVASNNNAKDFRDKVNWKVWYQVNGGEDYLIFNTFDKSLPPYCTQEMTSFISISLINTGLEGEVAVDINNQKIWIVCQ